MPPIRSFAAAYWIGNIHSSFPGASKREGLAETLSLSPSTYFPSYTFPSGGSILIAWDFFSAFRPVYCFFYVIRMACCG
ncbi:uncharacterized protein BDW43DRAFT_235210 [Aspergillus alliaceus]|uniref:uncharacterized protein n=1 Tax=Petromyces alliaceus TaxID=209559 RepID=UPI0012A536C6|nr:uncharacterized protein BDW43DRAFT_235210 [Aspergillus alliaceus]KAB8227853.1 hypothetical protein BDW43DRAFT_235210 [Aspergillus alliaceus]